MLILGIETSCDETGAAIISGNKKSDSVSIISSFIASSLYMHSKTGGIIPESAAREQVKFIIPVIQKTLEKAKLTIKDIDAIAVTYGPGLIGSLLIGVETAKAISYACDIPIIPTNHLIGHLYANWLVADSKSQMGKKLPSANIEFPAIGLIVSGGHTDLVLIKKHGEIKWLGGTRDDAAGECFDKCARLLGYDYPGGPKIAQLALKGDPNKFKFPRPMIGSHDSEFSFSGLKAAFLRETQLHFPVLRTSDKKISWEQIVLEEHIKQSQKQTLYDLCASLEKAIVDVIIKKTLNVCKKYDAKSLLLGGGVAANQSLRTNLQLTINNQKLAIRLFAPTKSLCTDNGAMIAAAAFHNGKQENFRLVDAKPGLYFD